MDYKKKQELKAKIKHENSIKKVGKCNYIPRYDEFDDYNIHDVAYDLMDSFNMLKGRYK